jgi:hypothetical protein
MSCLWWVLRLKFVASISFKQITDFLPDFPDPSVVNVKLDDGCIDFQGKKKTSLPRRHVQKNKSLRAGSAPAWADAVTRYCCEAKGSGKTTPNAALSWRH